MARNADAAGRLYCGGFRLAMIRCPGRCRRPFQASHFQSPRRAVPWPRPVQALVTEIFTSSNSVIRWLQRIKELMLECVTA